ncbi:MAG: RNA pseudouridine synthase, partial [Anaeroplasmataceae bacterium]|nr:RNA pseudouridine synthase [Anaeroplasmataceae bacterium]
ISHYQVLSSNDEESVLEFVLETGRTHQIRVHTSAMGHPIIGDTIYGGKSNPNLCLTSYFIQFLDPFTKKTVEYKIEKEW